MSDDNLKLKTKKWYLIVSYLLLGYAIYGTIQNLEYVKDSPGLYFLLILFVILFLNLHRAQVIFNQDKVTRIIFFFNIDIPYNQVKKIKVSKNRLKIYGPSEVVTFNNFMYTNFHSAINLLNKKVDKSSIKLTGKKEFVQEYFNSESVKN